MNRFFSNRDINRLALHMALVSLAWALAGIFFTVFLLRAGWAPAKIFLIAGAILGLRFALRPLVISVVAVAGLRNTLILGTALSAVQFLVIPFVHDVGTALAVYCAIASLSQVFYWTCYHVFFASLGDIERRGSQIGARQMLIALAGIAGPAVGGFMLTNFGPWPAFGVAFVAQMAAVYPLLHVEELKIARPAPRGAFAAARIGILLFSVDGWIQSGSATAWSIIMFQALAERYDAFGGVIAMAALGGALGGMALGRFIDLGHARRSVWLNAALLAAGLILKVMCGGHAIPVIIVTVGTTLCAGLYAPYWMTAIYNASKTAPCTFSFHFACEGGWDAGGVLASFVAAAICAAGLPLAFVILLAVPMVIVQALLVDVSYIAQNRARIGVHLE